MILRKPLLSVKENALTNQRFSSNCKAREVALQALPNAMIYGQATPERPTPVTRPPRRGRRQPFDIHRVIARLRAAAPSWNAPVVTLIANQSRDPFQILISCLLSLRTKDDTTGP